MRTHHIHQRPHNVDVLLSVFASSSIFQEFSEFFVLIRTTECKIKWFKPPTLRRHDNDKKIICDLICFRISVKEWVRLKYERKTFCLEKGNIMFEKKSGY